MANKELVGTLIKAIGETAAKITEAERKPKWLNSSLAERVRSKGSELKELYNSLSSNIENIIKLEMLSPIQMEKYRIRYSKAKKEKDLQKSQSLMYELASDIKEEILYFLGKDEAEKLEGLSREEKFHLAIQYGAMDFED